MVCLFLDLAAHYLIVSQGNVVIADQGQAQICDFGIAQILDPSSFMTMTQNNIRFTAPELMPAKEVGLFDIRPTRQSDIFSFGILLLPGMSMEMYALDRKLNIILPAFSWTR